MPRSGGAFSPVRAPEQDAAVQFETIGVYDMRNLIRDPIKVRFRGAEKVSDSRWVTAVICDAFFRNPAQDWMAICLNRELNNTGSRQPFPVFGGAEFEMSHFVTPNVAPEDTRAQSYSG